MRLFFSRWCEGEVLCAHVKCSMFIPLFCSLSQIPFDTRALQGPVIPGHWIQIKTSPMFLWLSVRLPFFSTISPLLLLELRREENPHRSSALEATNMTSTSELLPVLRRTWHPDGVCVQVLNFYNNITLYLCCYRASQTMWFMKALWGEKRKRGKTKERGLVAPRQHLEMVVNPSLGNFLCKLRE